MRRLKPIGPELSAVTLSILRRGAVEFEAVMTLGVMFPLAVVLYALAVKGFSYLHSLITCSLGWPYL